jgi:hypothetical protein
VRGEKLVLIDQRAPLADRVLALARAVTELENETIYMAPEAREFIEAIQGHVDLHRQRLNIWDEGPSGCLEETRAVKKDEVLAKLANGELKVDQASKLLEESGREGRGKLSCRVSEKGGVSVYGLQRMPVTLYVEQWEKLLGFADEIRQFLKEHDSELKRKPK